MPNVMRCTGNDPRRALGSAPDPLMRSRHQLVESSGKDAQRLEGKRTVTTKVEGRKKKKKREVNSLVFFERPYLHAGDDSVCPSSDLPGE